MGGGEEQPSQKKILRVQECECGFSLSLIPKADNLLMPVIKALKKYIY